MIRYIMLLCVILLCSCSKDANDASPQDVFKFQIDRVNFANQNVNTVYHQPSDRLVIRANTNDTEFIELRFKDISTTKVGTALSDHNNIITYYKGDDFYYNQTLFTGSASEFQITQFNQTTANLAAEYSGFGLSNFYGGSFFSLDGNFNIQQYKNNLSQLITTATIQLDDIDLNLENPSLGYIGNNGQFLLDLPTDEFNLTQLRFPRNISVGSHAINFSFFPISSDDISLLFKSSQEPVNAVNGELTVLRHDLDKREIELELNINYWTPTDQKTLTATFEGFYF